MVRLISQLKGSLRYQFVVLKLGSEARTQTPFVRHDDIITRGDSLRGDGAMRIPNLRALMEHRGQIPANATPPRVVESAPLQQH